MISYTINEPGYQTSTLPEKAIFSCGICGAKNQKNNVTTGPYNAANEITFICNAHLRSSHQLISLLAEYIVNEQRYFMEGEDFEKINRKAPNAWFFY